MDLHPSKPTRRSTPGKLDDITRRKILDAILRGSTIETAAGSLNISGRAVKALVERDPEFAAQCQDAREKADDAVISRLWLDACAGVTTAQIFWLKNRRPKEWRDRHDLVVSGEPTTFDTDKPRVEIAVVEGVPLESVRA